MLLALDTSTGTLGAAVLRDGRVLAESVHEDSRRHGELLAPAIRDALADAGASVRGLTAVAVGVGPGPFTGLRVGVVTALVLARTRGLPVYAVCSLDAVAEQAVADGAVDGEFLVATDARRREVYWATYAVRDGIPVRTDGPAVGAAADLPEPVRALPAVGRGPLLYPDALRAVVGPTDVSPAALGQLVTRVLEQGEPADGILLPPEPLYLRRPDATVPGAPAQVRP